MTQETLNYLQTEQRKMNRQATWVVISLAASIHLILNIYAYLADDSILKIEAPVISIITIAAVIFGLKFFSHSKN